MKSSRDRDGRSDKIVFKYKYTVHPMPIIKRLAYRSPSIHAKPNHSKSRMRFSAVVILAIAAAIAKAAPFDPSVQHGGSKNPGKPIQWKADPPGTYDPPLQHGGPRNPRDPLIWKADAADPFPIQHGGPRNPRDPLIWKAEA